MSVRSIPFINRLQFDECQLLLFCLIFSSCTLMLRYKTKRSAYEQMIVSEHIPIKASQLQATTEGMIYAIYKSQHLNQSLYLISIEIDEYDFLCRFQVGISHCI